MPTETERKFLVDQEMVEELKEKAASRKNLKQAYLAIDDEREVRLRRIGNEKYVLTVKTSGELTRDEYEIELNPRQAEEMMPLMQSRYLHKTRYEIPYKNHQVEMDVYHDDLEGLVVAEVEFENESEAAEFDHPDWLLQEITADKRLKNHNLVGKSWKEVQKLVVGHF